MNSTARPTPPVRRPPWSGEGRATVTRLSPPGAEPEEVPIASVQGTLALDLRQVPAEPVVPDLRMVPRPNRAPGAGERSGSEEYQDDGGDVHVWAARFAQATVEVIGGDRPVGQLVRWTTARVYQDLERRARILARTAPAPGTTRAVRPQVRSVHVCRPAPATAEVSVHVRHGHRSRAIAARLEHRGGRWTCVALQFG